METSKTLRPQTSITIIIPACSCFPFLVYSSINFVVQTSTGQRVGSSPIHVDSWKCRHGSLTGTSIFFEKKLILFLMALIFTYNSPRRDWQKIKTQPLPMQHPKLSMS